MMIGAFGAPIPPAVLDFYRMSYLNDPPNGYGITTAALHAVISNGVEFEYNALGFYPGLTRDVFAQLDRLSVPKTILGNEQGWKVPTGDAYTALPADHPVRLAYAENNALSAPIHPGRAKNTPPTTSSRCTTSRAGWARSPRKFRVTQLSANSAPGRGPTMPAPATGSLSSPRAGLEVPGPQIIPLPKPPSPLKFRWTREVTRPTKNKWASA